MAASVVSELPAAIETPVLAPACDGDDQVLRSVAVALGMDPTTQVELQVPDVGFVQVCVASEHSLQSVS